MGSFYSQCSISGINITDNEPVVRILLLPRWNTVTRRRFLEDGNDYSINKITKGLKVSNDSPWGDYIPFAFPLKGYYRDYGQVRDFENTENVKKIEEFFGGLDIETIVECAEDGRWIEYLEDDSDDICGFSINDKLEDKPNINILKELAFTDIRKDVYDKLVDMFEDEVERYWFAYHYDTPEQWLDYFGRVEELMNGEMSTYNTEEFREAGELFDEGKITEDEFHEAYEQFKKYNDYQMGKIDSFVPNYSWFNFLNKLRYDKSFDEEYKEFAKFHLIISRMNIWIENSNYGTQETNHELYIDFYGSLLENLKKEQEEY